MGNIGKKIILASLIFLLTGYTCRAADPSDIPGQIAKAESLSWVDKLEEASATYTKVLAEDPTNIRARIGLARVTVWQGKNFSGMQMYQDILKDAPNNTEALIGLAYVQLWSGREDLSQRTLVRILEIDPSNSEAWKLLKQMDASQSPYVNQFNNCYSDSNSLSFLMYGLRTGMHTSPLTSIDIIYGQQISRNATDYLGNKIGIGLDHRFNQNVEINTFSYKTFFTTGDFSPFTTNTWLTIKPDDFWRFDIGYDRELFDDVGSISNKIITEGYSLSSDMRPNRFLLLSLKYKKAAYSDTNIQDITSGRIEYRISNAPYTKLFYNYYYSSWTKQLSNGYFNPLSVLSQKIGIFSSFGITQWLSGEINGSIGYENQRPLSDHPVYNLSAGLNSKLAQDWSIYARGEYFEAKPDPNSNGYLKRSFSIGITHNFSTEDLSRLHNASGPSRTTDQ